MSLIKIDYILLLFIVSCTGIIRYRKLSMAFKILTWSVFAILLTTIADDIFIAKYRHNAPVLQIQCLEEYIFYSLVYYYLFKNKNVKKLIIVSIIIVSIFFPINAIFFQPFNFAFPTNINTTAQVLDTAFAFFLFKEMLDYPVKMKIVKQSVFWFNTAMLFYSTTIFFMLGISNYLAERAFEDKIISDLWYFIDYTFHILIGIALLTSSKEIVIEKAG